MQRGLRGLQLKNRPVVVDEPNEVGPGPWVDGDVDVSSEARLENDIHSVPADDGVPHASTGEDSRDVFDGLHGSQRPRKRARA